MQWIKTTLREVWGLFVDDSLFAIAIAVWLLVVWAANHLRPSLHGRLAMLLFAGLALILLESTWRYARRKRVRRESGMRE